MTFPTVPFNLRQKEDILDAEFSGTLHRQTFDKLLMRRPILTGEMEGNFKAHVPLKMPRESNLSGGLHVKGLDLETLNVPLKIEEISLRTEEKAIDLETMAFVWEERRGKANGRITFSEKDVIADLDLSLDGLDWKNIETLLSYGDAEKAPLPGKKGDGTFPIQGDFHLEVGKFSYENLAWEPLHAEIKIKDDSVEMVFSDTRICGIGTPGTIKIAPGWISMNFALLAKGLPINPTSRCLTNEEIEGTYNLDGTIDGQGKPGELLKAINGKLKFRAKEGKINRSSMWTNIFEFLSINNFFTGGFTRFAKEGFRFSDARADMVLKGSVIQFKEGSIYGDSMDIAFEGEHDILTGKLDLKLLIAPFTTANWIVRHTPIINYLLGGNIGTIPVKVTGTIKDPKVNALPLSSVGSELIGVLERTLKAPLTAVESMDAEMKEKK